MAQPIGLKNLADIQAISFDLDDTLWDCASVISKAEQALFEWHHRVTPLVTEVHTPESLQSYRTQVRKDNPTLKGCVTAMRMKGLKQLLSEFDYPEDLADEGFDVFYKARSDVKLYEGAEEVLDTLGRRFKLAAITNGNADLKRIGIAENFDKVYAADLTLKEKPAPDMFELCLKDLNIPAKSLLHIGDNPVTDVFGAQSAGVQSLWFNQYNQHWPEELGPPDFEVRALTEVVALFEL